MENSSELAERILALKYSGRSGMQEVNDARALLDAAIAEIRDEEGVKRALAVNVAGEHMKEFITKNRVEPLEAEAQFLRSQNARAAFRNSLLIQILDGTYEGEAPDPDYEHPVTDRVMQLVKDNHQLRVWLATSYAGTALYHDDGELQDGREHPFIDFKRDSIEQLRAKMQQRLVRALAKEGIGKISLTS